MPRYFAAIRLTTASSLFQPTIWADHFDAPTAAKARERAAAKYERMRDLVTGDPRMDALIAEQPALGDGCRLHVRRSRS